MSDLLKPLSLSPRGAKTNLSSIPEGLQSNAFAATPLSRPKTIERGPLRPAAQALNRTGLIGNSQAIQNIFEHFWSLLGSAQQLAQVFRPFSARPPASENSLLKVPAGQITFDAEGNEGGKFHSRIATKPPGENSGVTIGRGYDMGNRSAKQVYSDLLRAGVSSQAALRLALGAGLKGKVAKHFVEANGGELPELSLLQQNTLFQQVSYPEYAADVQRIIAKPDVQARYGTIDWKDIHPSIREILVDLRYRGDYTPDTREKIQGAVVRNNLEAFRQVLSDKNYWIQERGVPGDRFSRRVDYLKETFPPRQAGERASAED